MDITSYSERIYYEEDKTLFSEAVLCAERGALRAAYIMIWLSCAESFKRRFREAMIRDSVAGRVVGEINTKEEQQKSVDKYLIDEACKYGFILASDKIRLMHIYQMRCLYGHPYEEAPTIEQVQHAASTVVELVLSKTITLKHGFINQIIEDLMRKHNYLDDHDEAVWRFADDIVQRIDSSLYKWMLNEYFSKLEPIAKDPTMRLYYKRGLWFCDRMLHNCGVDCIPSEKWHDYIIQYPLTLSIICGVITRFPQINVIAQDSLVGLLIEQDKLKVLENLMEYGCLSERQAQRFHEHVESMSCFEQNRAGLGITYSYSTIIEALKHQNWYKQEPASRIVFNYQTEELEKLTDEQQIILGRNIAQVGEGCERFTCNMLSRFKEYIHLWPFDMIFGLFIELFTNENHEIRFKTRNMSNILDALDLLTNAQKAAMVSKISESIGIGKLRSSHSILQDFKHTIRVLDNYEWAKLLKETLLAREAEIMAIFE
jgi:hypothetical protein